MPDAATPSLPPPQDPHRDLHAEAGAEPGEHPGRSRNPVVKAADLAWLEFEKPDLARAEVFARDFGFAVAARTPEALYLRGTLAGPPCLVIRHGAASRFVGPAFLAAERADLDRLARACGVPVRAAEGPWGGRQVSLLDPSGLPVRVVHGQESLPELPAQRSLPLNTGLAYAGQQHADQSHAGQAHGAPQRLNAAQRPPREPARVERLGHLVLETPHYRRALDWYTGTLGLIVSDFLFLAGQRARGPVMSFMRCDRGGTPTDHHTLAMHLGPRLGYVHSAYQVADLDALAAGGEYLKERGYQRSWGIGRHIQGSQLFDYWRDPDRLMVEHFTDGDLFDASLEPGWAAMSASGLAQWGPPATRDFLGASPSPAVLRAALRALREDNEIDPARLRGLMKAMNS